jgi:putative membrane protein
MTERELMADERRARTEATGAPIDIDPRVPWAAERTMLAWVRTGAALMGFGFVVARFGFLLHQLASPEVSRLHHGGASQWGGLVMVVVGVAVNVVGTVRYRKQMRAILRGERLTFPSEVPAALGLGLAIAGALLVAILADSLFR